MLAVEKFMDLTIWRGVAPSWSCVKGARVNRGQERAPLPPQSRLTASLMSGSPPRCSSRSIILMLLRSAAKCSGVCSVWGWGGVICFASCLVNVWVCAVIYHAMLDIHSGSVVEQDLCCPHLVELGSNVQGRLAYLCVLLCHSLSLCVTTLLPPSFCLPSFSGSHSVLWHTGTLIPFHRPCGLVTTCCGSLCF